MRQSYRTHAEVGEDGTLTLSNLPFPAGEKVEVTVQFDPTAATEKDAPRSGDALSVLEDLIGTVEAPVDWAAEHDHYLYGTPKRSDRQP
jgi:hypothetical protein